MQREYGTDHTGNGSAPAAGTGIGFGATHQKRFKATAYVFNSGGGRHPMRIVRVGPLMEDACPSYSETRQEEPAVVTFAAGKEGTNTSYANVTDATVPVHVDFGGTRVHRRAACASSPEVGNDSHQITEIRRRGGTGVWPLGQASDGGGGDPICDPPTASKRHGGIWTGGTSGHQHPNHVVAYIPSALHKDTEWVMIDGMVQKVQRKPINTHKVILCLYRRLMPEMGPEEDEDDDEQESHARNREQDGRTLASAPKGSRLPQSQKWEEAPDDSSMVDGFGKNGYGQPPGSAAHSSPPASSSPSTQTITQDPFLPPIAPRKRGRRGRNRRRNPREKATMAGGLSAKRTRRDSYNRQFPQHRPNQTSRHHKANP
ncbi:putative SLACS retrotransposable element [Trypanosoma cruzi]|uniref:Putative SLACS retrotransposable element n=1 Tax=Trypanosoma cruzi TaxID=5693 RepID=A0A2V2ULM8_TRYCR|nr:putative SLACS retrotransposable element [Trypanosoma cruzi]